VNDPIEERLAEAQEFLGFLNFDAERRNERSALVLLALLDLGTRNAWSEVAASTLRTLEIMGTLRDRYGKSYKPSTRETIRRRTLHQFVEAGLIVINPDEPNRPVNSPKTCYRIEPAALQLREKLRPAGVSRGTP
jgi:hypothetical protein